jgi:hypothetical protein
VLTEFRRPWPEFTKDSAAGSCVSDNKSRIGSNGNENPLCIGLRLEYRMAGTVLRRLDVYGSGIVIVGNKNIVVGDMQNDTQ